MKENKELIWYLESVCLPLWDEWMDDVIAEKEEGQSDTLYVKQFFTKHYDCTENSPLAMMFAAFCGGIDRGLYLNEEMKKIQKMAKQPGKTKA